MKNKYGTVVMATPDLAKRDERVIKNVLRLLST